MLNHLLRENRKSVSLFVSGKTLFIKVSFQILNFIQVIQLIKMFLILCNVEFSLLFDIVFNMGNCLFLNLTRQTLIFGGLRF